MRLCYLFKYFCKAGIKCRSTSLSDRIVLLLLLMLSSGTSLAEPSYQVFIIPTDEPAVAVSINDAGEITGYVESDSVQHAFFYDLDVGLEFLGTLGGEISSPATINELTQIVGSSTRSDGLTHAFLWDTESGIIDLTPSHTGITHATDISNRAIAVGTATPDNAFEWMQDSGFQIVTDEREGYGIAYLGIADNGIKLVKSSGPDSSVGTSYFLSSIPGQNDFHIASENLGTGQVRISGINNLGVAAGWKKSRDGFSTETFYADPSTRQFTRILKSDLRLGSPAIIPVDINDKKWLLSSDSLYVPDIGMKRARKIGLELIAESSDHQNVIDTLSATAFNNHGDIVGSVILPNGQKAAVLLINENRDIEPTPAIAQYRRDFANPLSSGWQYQWNANVPIGQSTEYVDMQWDRWKYDSDGLPGLPDASGLAYGHFSENGGHPGLGATQGEQNDRYVIAGYKIDQTGVYKISDSHLLHTGCDGSNSNGGAIKVYVNDILIDNYTFDSGGITHFDGNLGLINAGSMIYVAVGPDASDICDGFEWDYAIRLVRAVDGNQPPVLDNPGNQISQLDEDINLILNAIDPDGDPLNFEASGLPEGLSINNDSGVILGIPSLIGIYNVLVTVTDEQGGFDTVEFDWVINGTNTVARYSTDFNRRQPARGWRYQWNPNAPIGQADGYVDMKWDRWKYDSDGLPGLPDASGLAYGHFSATGGHPGLGTSTGEANSRYVIAGFAVDATREYKISDSQIIHSGCEYGDGQEIDIYVDDNFIASFNLDRAAGSVATFDVNLGLINAGSVIYVAVGPGARDGCDGFEWDYAIEQINILFP